MKNNLGDGVTALFVPGYGRIPALEVAFVPPNLERNTFNPIPAADYLAVVAGYYQLPAPEDSSVLIVPISAAYLLYEGENEAAELNREWAEKIYLRSPQQFAVR